MNTNLKNKKNEILVNESKKKIESKNEKNKNVKAKYLFKDTEPILRNFIQM